MKKLIITTVVFSALIIGCKESKDRHVTNDTPLETHEAHEVDSNSSETALTTWKNDWIHEIVLNKGSKWEANKETTEGVATMLEMVKNSTPKTTDEYRALAANLNDEKNTLVKKCTMKGPSHDNLHVFLHPLIEKIDALLQVSSVNNGAKILASIQENLEAYDSYFQ